MARKGKQKEPPPAQAKKSPVPPQPPLLGTTGEQATSNAAFVTPTSYRSPLVSPSRPQPTIAIDPPEEEEYGEGDEEGEDDEGGR